MCDFDVSRVSNLCFKIIIVLKTVFTKHKKREKPIMDFNAPEASLPGYVKFWMNFMKKYKLKIKTSLFMKLSKHLEVNGVSHRNRFWVVTCRSACFFIDMTIGWIYLGLSKISEIPINILWYKNILNPQKTSYHMSDNNC